ncbi:conserved hypothetical protein [Mesorhizobium plurifarium]|uniref:SnoaL-like domain-containing protein n=1 Tax=Mesorhizobium plurifarium TaxID=69974 RepID=A0A090EMA0_MESPL|nr:conserved hypothetical protein [Mesorhizobium plurifarium]
MSTILELEKAAQSYFDVLYECSLDKFEALFHPSCSLFTVQDGKETVLSLDRYREIIAARQSPASIAQPRKERLENILTLSADAALVAVSVRVHDKRFKDHLAMRP